jgi:hypothetical protein
MCIRTVSGEDILEFSLHTVPGTDSFIDRVVSGNTSTEPTLQNTLPTFTTIDGPASGTYTPPVGCLYYEVFLVGGGGSGAGGGTGSFDRYGGGGGGGDTAYGIFTAVPNTYNIGGTVAGGAAGASGTSGVSSTFATITATRGSSGQFVTSISGSFYGRTGIASTNSLIQYGRCASQAPGGAASSGGMSLMLGGFARGSYSTSAIAGSDGFYSGGSGATGSSAGGDGSAGKLLVIEYY